MKNISKARYTLIFDTTIPKGNTTGEKVLSLASLIFPQLRADYFDYYYVANFAKAFNLPNHGRTKLKQV